MLLDLDFKHLLILAHILEGSKRSKIGGTKAFVKASMKIVSTNPFGR